MGRPERGRQSGAHAQPDPAARRLVRLRSFRAAFEPVVDCVADHVGQRFGDLVDHRLVHLRVFTFRHQADERGLVLLALKSEAESREAMAERIRGWLAAVEWSAKVRVSVDVDPYSFL